MPVPATEIQTGEAKMYGVSNDGTARCSIAGIAQCVLQSAKLEVKWDIQTDKDGDNADVTGIATNGYYEVMMDFHPSGTTRAAAYAAGVIFAPFAHVILTHFAHPLLTGTWIFWGSQNIDLQHNASGKMNLTLRFYIDPAQMASMLNLITG